MTDDPELHTTYTQPMQRSKPWTWNHDEGDVGLRTPGVDCLHCGHAGHDHEKTRVSTDVGYHYRMVCPT